VITWAILGPALTLAGILVGLGVGWGIMKSAVARLELATGKLEGIATAVTILQTQRTVDAANLADLLHRVHALELDLARLTATN
jgi:hypothetical protein